MISVRFLFSFYFRELESRKPRKCTAKLQKLGEYDPEGELIIRDPYFVSAYILKIYSLFI